MAETSGSTRQNAEEQAGSAGAGKTVTTGSSSPARLADETSQGKTTIAASVVQKIAGIAAREISGVHAMGGGVSRAFGAIRERIPGGSGTTSTSGVQVEVGEKQAAIDLDIVVEYGASIVELARAVRRNVITGVERMTGLEVIEVNIAVNDIHLPSDDDEENGSAAGGSASSRVE
ncbi:Asp23/Gls24 family envelope stress response protein [Saccharopolyspora sp. HNM0986]|uniref:Asp23/Gls24 family envelope stress response protein n=1 Tax=Saccharopolyspora galaxeae TaxID=2781241 RepID=UPI001909FAE5|nr:Asp23/Gls24 family envelope stress response protein [Saccharopolyspora sp. HNM0986]MBK0868619.1 Asp23/Gls24 family envelope stress response protein [Saccharopolyspora sp. HNM0986]